MRTNKMFFHTAVASIAYLTGCAGAALADTEASFQAGSQADHQFSSENGHVGESQSNHQSMSQGGNSSSTGANHENASEATQETGRLPIKQGSLTGTVPAAQGTTSSAAAQSSGGSRVTTEARPGSVTSAPRVPVMKTTTYRWKKGSSHPRTAYSRGTNHTYMVKTIHQAAAMR